MIFVEDFISQIIVGMVKSSYSVGENDTNNLRVSKKPK
jgi:hypothetical protein